MSLELVKKTLREIRSHKLQFIALVLITSIGVGVFLSFGSLYSGRSKYYDEIYHELRLTSMNLDFPAQWILEEDLLQIVDQNEEIEGYEPRIQHPLIINLTNTLDRYFYTSGLAIGVQTTELTVNKLYVTEGRDFETSDNNQSVILVETHFAQAYDLHPGQHLIININKNEYSCLIVGSVLSPEYISVIRPGPQIMSNEKDYGIIFFPLSTLQNILNTNLVNGISIRLFEEYESHSEEIALQIKERIENSGSYVVDLTLREDIPSYSSFTQASEAGGEAIYIIPCIIFVVAAFGVYISISRQIIAERRQIGIIMALGHSSKTIILH
ncbi:MAG: ABC transporter permease, partial [Candidatus Hodarchaeota archaeon]